MTKLDKTNQKQLCIQACLECYRVCQTTALHRTHGPQTPVRDVRLLLDCAALCQACADFMTANSDLEARFCQTAADICLRCAQECARFDGDAQMQLCATVCHRCAESCRQMTFKAVALQAPPAPWPTGAAEESSSLPSYNP